MIEFALLVLIIIIAVWWIGGRTAEGMWSDKWQRDIAAEQLRKDVVWVEGPGRRLEFEMCCQGMGPRGCRKDLLPGGDCKKCGVKRLGYAGACMGYCAGRDGGRYAGMTKLCNRVST